MVEVKIGSNSEVDRIANRNSICPLQCYSARGDTELANEIAITVVDSVANELACGSQTNECNRTVQRSTMIKDQIKDIIA